MEFRKVPGYFVEVSACGIIRRESDGYIYRVQTCRLGYKRVGLFTVGTKRTNLGVHRAVALAWLPNPENKNTVNHKDLNKANNHVDNLEWATMVEQHDHLSRNGGKKNVGKKFYKPERNDELVAMREAGTSYKKIGEHFGISGVRAREIILEHNKRGFRAARRG